MKELNIRGKKIKLPVFLPDATKGYVRAVSSSDLVDCNIQGVVVNTYHLFREGLVNEIKKKGGIGKWMDFKGLTLSDSGGFQVFSLIHANKENGYLDDDGATFVLDGHRAELTPEKCIQIQIDIGADIVMCLDDCTSVDMSLEAQEKSVERTVKWAKRCKKEFENLTKNLDDCEKPLIFGIIQGGKNFDLRKKCADELIKIGFDGYAFGGWPVEDKKFLTDLLKYTAELMPDDKLKYAMGVGKPEDIVNCVCMGYNMFDCVIPTREARNNRLYAFKSGFFGGIKKPRGDNGFYDYVRIRNTEQKKNKKPISKHCKGICCKNYQSKDIYELFKAKDKESIRLTTMHNLRFYTMLMRMLRKGK